MAVTANHTKAQSLGVPTSAFDGFSAPFLLFDGNGQVSRAEPATLGLDVAYASGQIAELTTAVQGVLTDGRARQISVQVDLGAGVNAFDLALIPVADGGALAIGREVTLHHNLRAALVESRQRYKDFVEISSDFAWETGPTGAFIFVSPRGALGHAAADLVGSDPLDLLGEDENRADAEEIFQAAVPIEDQDLWLLRADGTTSCVQVSAQPVFDRDGKRVGTRGVCRDVTVERERDSQLARARNRERILNHIVRAFRDEVDPQNMLRVAAETVSRGMGAESCQIFRRAAPGHRVPGTAAEDAGTAEDAPVHVLSLDADAVQVEGFLLSAAAGTVATEAAAATLARLSDGEDIVAAQVDGRQVLAAPTRYRHRANGAVVLWRPASRGEWTTDERMLAEDIADQIGIANEQIAAHEDIVRISRTDGLTGLFNRRAFFEELERRFMRLNRGRQTAALMYIDLDNFKMVNDMRGHAEGDMILRLVRDILIENTRPTDLVARLGGDEFAIWLESGGGTIAQTKAERLLAVAGQRMLPLSGTASHPLGLSIGVAIYDPDHPETLDALMARADQAMYGIKHGGKSGAAIADPAGVDVGGGG